jgi:formylglycine-generating enzyme required for sulfatase activity
MNCRVVIFTYILLYSAAMARNVNVSNITVQRINSEYSTITYDLSRSNPAISTSQPVWIFVKYRLTSENDYTGWKDTDDLNAANDASDTNTDLRAVSVNANLSGNVGIVSSAGTKTITWHRGGTGGIGQGSGLSTSHSVRIRIYVIELAFIAGGNIEFRQDSGFTVRTLTGNTAKCANDFYMMKYPVTVEMYKDFLNAAANRHDKTGTIDNLKDYFTRNSYPGTVIAPADSMRNMLWTADNFYGVLTLSGTVGVDAVWDVYGGDGQRTARSRYPMNHLSWFNCYDFAAWCGLSLLEEEHYYKVASENGQSIYYWGNTTPNSSLCNYRDSAINHPTDVTVYEINVDAVDEGPLYGVYELAGNVWEWTSTTADGYYSNDPIPYNSAKGPIHYTTSAVTAVKKTARWYTPIDQLYSAIRYFGDLNRRYDPSSFRCGYFGGN